MARKPPKLKVHFSPRSLTALDEIWEWNARIYDADHADRYITFLEEKANGLATTYVRGKIVPTAPELQYITISRRRRGHAHVAIYKIVNGQVNLLNFYHTAQDWQNKLARGEW